MCSLDCQPCVNNTPLLLQREHFLSQAINISCRLKSIVFPEQKDRPDNFLDYSLSEIALSCCDGSQQP